MPERADEVLANGVVYTLDPSRPWATGLAIGDGRIIAAGDDLDELRGPATRVRDLHGAFVLPGLVDVHNHHALAGRAELYELRLPEGAGLDQILAAVRDYANGREPADWIAGGGWDSTLLGQVGEPAALRALDEAAGGRPVLLTDDSRHNRWANTRALELAGLPLRSGLLLEAAGLAAERALRAAAPLTREQHVTASRRGIEVLHSHGVTAFQDAGVSIEIMRALKSLDDAGELRAWVVTSMLANDRIFGFEPVGAELIAAGGAFRSAHHRPDFIKIFLDGTPPALTAAFLEPYLPVSDDFRGEPVMSLPELTGWLRLASQAGLSAKVHCTGDAAVRMVLDSIQQLGPDAPVVQVAHGQFIATSDVSRFAQLGVSADISPFIWMPGVIPAAIAGVLPADRACRMQPNRDLLDAGALVAGGSDWPVCPRPDLWYGIAGLVTRADPDGRYPGALWPEQAITLAEAIAVFTLNAARSMGVDDVTGSLSPGKSADFVILDRNPFDCPAEWLASTVTLETVFAGETVFEKALALRPVAELARGEQMASVPSSRIGANGPETGILALGSWHTYDRMPFAETVQLLRTAVAAGITLFDVGVYGTPGQPPVFTDVIFSAAVRAAGLAREDYLLSVKLWLEDYPEQSLRDQLDHALMRCAGERADVAILGDLRRQGTDMERLVLELAELHAQGLLGAWGVNNWSAASVQALIDAAARHSVAGPAMAQLKYSVARRSIADGAPFAKIFAQGVSLEASDVLEGGVLLGKSGRQAGRDPGGLRERIVGSVGSLNELAAEAGATPAQLCVAFTLTHPALATTLIGVTSLAQLNENIAAIDLVNRVGAARIRALAEPLWADRGIVDPEGP